jgi:hypothetical protein
MSCENFISVITTCGCVLFFPSMSQGQNDSAARQGSQGSGKELGPVSTMTKQEASVVRKLIYFGPLGTHIRLDLPFPQREVALSPQLMTLHKVKRVAVIKLLLEIARGGRPKDALTAGIMAIALEEGPLDAVPLLDIGLASIDSFDNPAPDQKAKTLRETLVGRVEDLLAKAEKAHKADQQ